MALSFSRRLVEEGDTAYCSICEGDRKIEGVANTELYTYGGRASTCNIAIKLSCGHIFVDDCRLEELNGEFFYDEEEWRRRVVTEAY